MGSIFRPSPPRRFALALAAPQCILLKEGCDRLVSAGGKQQARRFLADSWGSPDEPAYRKTLEWLTGPGHQATLAEDLRDQDSPRRAFLKTVTGPGIQAWDLGRAVQVARWGHTAGYVPRDEAWQIVETAGQRAGATFTNWQDYGRSYGLGADYWMLILEQPPIPDFALAIKQAHWVWRGVPWPARRA